MAQRQDKNRGVLLGLAVGDAMGHTVDRRSVAEICSDYGPNGLLGYDLVNGYADITSYTQLVMTLMGVPGPQIFTACAAVMATVGMFVLRQTCKPFDLFRHILWWAMAIALVFCFTVLGRFFDLTRGDLKATVVMLLFMAAAPVVFKALRTGLECLGKQLKK